MTSKFVHEITDKLRREPFASKEQGMAVEELLDAYEDLESLVRIGVGLVAELRGWVEFDSSGLLDRSQGFVERGEEAVR